MEHKKINTPFGPVGALLWPGQGEMVVLVHGLFDSAYTWRGVAQHINNPVIAFDLPGFGMSQVPKRGDVALFADTLLAALEKEGVDRFHLVGHSFGGAIVSEMAGRDKGDVLSLFLVAPAGYGSFRFVDFISSAPIRKATSFLGKQITGSKMATDFAYAYFVSNGRHLDEKTLLHLTDLGEERQKGIAMSLEALSRYSKENSLRENFYPGPKAYLWGDADSRIPKKHIDKLEEVLPGIHAHIWPGSGHHPQHEDPKGFSILLENLIHDSERARRRS